MATRRPLHHPIFLGALLLLVLNDHVLKGAGIMPSWLTGKLSDFAGLIVAPIVLASLLRLKSRTSILAGHVLIGIVFAMAEMSQGMADQLASLWRLFGLSHAAFVADPTDLWALTILPVPFALLCASKAPARTGTSHASLGAALIACIATPAPPQGPSWTTSGFVVNRTTTVRDVRLHWTRASLDCDALAAPGADLGRMVQPEIFTRSLDFQVGLDVTLPLNEDEATRAAQQVDTARGVRRDAGPLADAGPQDAGATGASRSAACELVLVQTAGFPDRIVLLDAARSSVFENQSASRADARALRFVDAGIEIGSELRVAAAVPEDFATTCRPPAAPITLEPALRPSEATLSAAVPRDDACVEFTLTEDRGASSTHVLCGVPVEFFPFAVGSVVHITTDLGITSLADDTGAVSLEIQQTRSSSARSLAPCNGERLACGGFVIPAEPPETLLTTTTAPDGTRVRTLQGRSESVVVGLPDCEPARREAGFHVGTATTKDRQ